MNDQILALEIKLLIARHGKRKVLEALATATDQSLVAIEAEINAVEEKKKAPRTRRTKSPDELIASACSQRPELLSDVTALVRRYEDKTFLPQLRQVERFLDHAKVTHGKLKSRKAALPIVVSALASMTKPQLSSLLETHVGRVDSEFSLLANEIMGKREKE